MDLDHVDMTEHSREAGVGRAVAVAVVEHPADVRMVHLHQLVGMLIPECQPLDLNGGVGIGRGAAAVLRMGPHHQRKGVLMVQGQRVAGQLDADAGGHERLCAESLQVGIIAREPVVLGAGGELNVLAEQVEHAAKLAGRVVAGGTGMAVEIGADPAISLDGPDEPGFQARLLALDNLDGREHGVVLRAVADDHVVAARIQIPLEAAVLAVIEVPDRMLAGIGAEVGADGPVAARELDLARNRFSLCVGDRRHDASRDRQLDSEGGSGPGPIGTVLDPRPGAVMVSVPGPSSTVTVTLPLSSVRPHARRLPARSTATWA